MDTFGKAQTYYRYFKDFIKHREFGFILTSIGYELFGRPGKKSGEYTSSLGRFFIRSGTLDFKFANFAYEWPLKKFILKHHTDYSIFLDIGANIGVYSILMAGKGLKCHAFEPMPDNYQAMIRNFELNKLENNIRSHNIALGNEECYCEFIYEKVNTGASRIATRQGDFHRTKSSDEKVLSRVRTLDGISKELLISNDDKLLIKIDAEGMEHSIIEGAIEFLKTHRYILLIVEKKYQSVEMLTKTLNLSGNFKCIPVDEYNLAFLKI